MLNLAKVLCLLLVAAASGAFGLGFLDQAKKAFDKAMTSSREEMKKSCVENLACMKTEKMNLLMKIEASPSLSAKWIGVRLSNSHRTGAFAVDRPNLRKSNVLKPPSIQSFNDSHITLIEKEYDRLLEIFREEYRGFHEYQRDADDCVSRYPDTFFGRPEHASCLGEVQKALRDKVESAKLRMSKVCDNVKKIAESTLNS